MIVARMVFLSIALLTNADSTCKPNPPVQGKTVAMRVDIVGVDGNKIKLMLSFLNLIKQPQLMSEDIGLSGPCISTLDSTKYFDLENEYADHQVLPHYVLLPVVSERRREAGKWCCHIAFSKYMTIEPSEDIPSGDGAFELAANLKILEYNEKTKSLEPREEKLSFKQDLADFRDQLEQLKKKEAKQPVGSPEEGE